MPPKKHADLLSNQLAMPEQPMRTITNHPATLEHQPEQCSYNQETTQKNLAALDGNSSKHIYKEQPKRITEQPLSNTLWRPLTTPKNTL